MNSDYIRGLVICGYCRNRYFCSHKFSEYCVIKQSTIRYENELLEVQGE